MKPSEFIKLIATVLVGGALIWGIVFLAIQADFFQILKRNWEIWSIAFFLCLFVFAFILRRYGYDIGE